jgi:pyridoxine 5-phosphate synthase
MPRLSVNLNRIALLRNSRGIGIPDLLHFARLAIDAGAHGLTVHPRPDQRHITLADVHDIRDLLQDFPALEFNIEGNPFSEGPAAFMPLVEAIRPAQCTLVPDDDVQATSDHGWDLSRDGRRVSGVVERLHALGMRVSLFMDAQTTAMEQAAECGADRVELYTKPWADAFGTGNLYGSTPESAQAVLQRFVEAAQSAHGLGLGVNAGHDLNLVNLPAFVRTVPSLDEASIGHALTADALEYGYHLTVRAYVAALSGADHGELQAMLASSRPSFVNESK